MNEAKMSNHTTPCRHTIEAEGEGFRIWFRPRYIEHQKCGLFKSIEKARESLWVVPPAITRYYPDAIEEYGSEENEPETIDLPVGLMIFVPVTLDEAKDFVRRHHRHNKPDVSWKFGVGLEVNGELVGVAVAGRCKARPLDTKQNIEITRVCVHDTRNGNSRLYGAILRAAKSLGYKTAYTYTLQSESGASLKASGWTLDAELKPRASWSCPSRPRMQTNMFGEEQRPTEAKVRWKHPL